MGRSDGDDSFEEFLRERPPASSNDLDGYGLPTVELRSLADEFGLTIGQALALCRRLEIPAENGSSRVLQRNADRFRWWAADSGTLEELDRDPAQGASELSQLARLDPAATPFGDPLAGGDPVRLEHDRRAAHRRLIVGGICFVLGAGVSVWAFLVSSGVHPVIWFAPVTFGALELGRGYQKLEETKRAEHTLAMLEHRRGWGNELR